MVVDYVRRQGAADGTLDRIRRLSAVTVTLPSISPLEQRLEATKYVEEEEKRKAEVETVAEEFDRVLREKVRIACLRIDDIADEYALKAYPAIDEEVRTFEQCARVKASSKQIFIDVNNDLREPSVLGDDPRRRVTMIYRAGKTHLSFRNYRSGAWFMPYFPATFCGAATATLVVATANGTGTDDSAGLAVVYGIPFLISAALGAYRTWSRLHFRGDASRLADEDYDAKMKAEGAEQLTLFPEYLKAALEQHYARPLKAHAAKLRELACERDTLLDATRHIQT